MRRVWKNQNLQLLVVLMFGAVTSIWFSTTKIYKSIIWYNGKYSILCKSYADSYSETQAKYHELDRLIYTCIRYLWFGFNNLLQNNFMYKLCLLYNYCILHKGTISLLLNNKTIFSCSLKKKTHHLKQIYPS